MCYRFDDSSLRFACCFDSWSCSIHASKYDREEAGVLGGSACFAFYLKSVSFYNLVRSAIALAIICNGFSDIDIYERGQDSTFPFQLL